MTNLAWCAATRDVQWMPVYRSVPYLSQPIPHAGRSTHLIDRLWRNQWMTWKWLKSSSLKSHSSKDKSVKVLSKTRASLTTRSSGRLCAHGCTCVGMHSGHCLFVVTVAHFLSPSWPYSSNRKQSEVAGWLAGWPVVVDKAIDWTRAYRSSINVVHLCPYKTKCKAMIFQPDIRLM